MSTLPARDPLPDTMPPADAAGAAAPAPRSATTRSAATARAADARADRDTARLARAALSRLVEPGDETALTVIEVLGPDQALAVLTARRRLQGDEEEQLVEAAAAGGDAWRRRFRAGLRRWAPRAAELDPARDLVAVHRLGGGLLIPEDPAWPEALDDLGPRRPVGLWTRGTARLPEPGRTLAVVGSREATAYGRAVTAQLVGPLAAEGVTVLSGGAYGIDGHAHRVALESGRAQPPTVAVLAGGLDRFYPAGHADLLRAVMDRGLLLSEMPPGASPTRHRFLHRNRLIAALAAGVLVVEARWRSGAQNTASHALDLGRELGVVPGAVTSPSSAGCHRLLAETPARLVADTEAAWALLPDHAQPPGPRPSRPGRPSGPAPSCGLRDDAVARPEDGLSEQELLVYDALPVRAHVGVDRLAVTAGLPVPLLLAVLQRFARTGLAEERDRCWRRGARR